MRRILPVLMMFGGCAVPRPYNDGRGAGPPAYGQVAPATPSRSASPFDDPFATQDQPPLDRPSLPERFGKWFASGKGWTWGRASLSPYRDAGLDRIMVDTLESSAHNYNHDPITSWPRSRGGESWSYPAPR